VLSAWEEFERSTLEARPAKTHWHIDISEDYVSDRDPAQVLRAADFDVVEDDGRLIAVTRKRRLQFDLLRIFERRKLLSAAASRSWTVARWSHGATSDHSWCPNAS
jgi:hypothetical protein